MNRKLLLGLIPIIVIIGCTAIILSQSSIAPATGAPRELDFTVSGKNPCLRFLNSSVSTVYIPIATGANENWELTINATNMAGGAGGWVDLYVYNGYWDCGTNNTCVAKDTYPILSSIEDANTQIKANAPYTQTFGGATAETHTLFFIFPPSGQSTFHVTLKQIH
jgi:hypothetical protein